MTATTDRRPGPACGGEQGQLIFWRDLGTSPSPQLPPRQVSRWKGEDIGGRVTRRALSVDSSPPAPCTTFKALQVHNGLAYV